MIAIMRSLMKTQRFALTAEDPDETIASGKLYLDKLPNQVYDTNLGYFNRRVEIEIPSLQYCELENAIR